MSHILAFDFFVNNVDRHNTITFFQEIKEQLRIIGDGLEGLGYIDGFPLKPPPMGKGENTREFINFFKNRFGDYVPIFLK